jgi:very-short-patch-repair endonuclease
MVTKKELILKETMSSTGRIDKRSIKRVLEKHCLLDEVSNLRKDLSEAFYWWVNNFSSHPKPCKTCGGDLKFNGFKDAYTVNDYCSVKCATPENLNKSKKTIMEKYGVNHQMKIDSVKEKIKKTNVEKYGSTGYLGSNKAKERFKELFGTEHISKTDNWKSKVRKTFIERYGSMNVGEDSIINVKARQTLSNYLGVAWPNDYSFQQLSAWKHSYSVVLDKCANGQFTNMAIDFVNKKVSALHSCGKLSEWQYKRAIRCYHCSPKNSSSFEIEVQAFLKQLDVNFIKNDRQTIRPLELDFYVPEKKIAIECNGDYWHSYSRKESQAERNKHVYKLEKCEHNGIRLIQIPEHLWYERQDQIKFILRSALNKNSNRIFARQCDIVKISSKEANAFCKKYHLFGSAGCTTAYGLCFKNELVQVITLAKSRFRKDNSWEVIRLASKFDTTIIGGVAKLLKKAKDEIPFPILSYVDRQFFDGASFKKIANLESTTQPGYIWIYKGEFISRYKCQKQKLPTLLGDVFNPNLSEHENMFNAGASRLWNCGNFVFKIK